MQGIRQRHPMNRFTRGLTDIILTWLHWILIVGHLAWVHNSLIHLLASLHWTLILSVSWHLIFHAIIFQDLINIIIMQAITLCLFHGSLSDFFYYAVDILNCQCNTWAKLSSTTCQVLASTWRSNNSLFLSWISAVILSIYSWPLTALVVRGSDSDLSARILSTSNYHDNMHSHNLLYVCDNSHLSQMADCSLFKSYLPDAVGRR